MIGLAAALVNINAGVLFMQITPDDMRGRMSAFMSTVSQFMAPVGLSLFSMVAASDKRYIFYFPVASGVLVLIFALSLLAVKGYRDL